MTDGETRRILRPGKCLHFYAVDTRQRWAVQQQLLLKCRRIARQTHQHAFAVVTDITAKTQLIRQLPDKGAETHPLYLAAHP
ncbi:hypothetical protein D3C87_1850110 [compost metagenome]